MIAYIAKLYNENLPDALSEVVKPHHIFPNCAASGIEIFETPYDAIANLAMKIRLYQHSRITVYNAAINEKDIIKISNGIEIMTLCSVNTVFVKKCDYVLGGIANYLNGGF